MKPGRGAILRSPLATGLSARVEYVAIAVLNIASPGDRHGPVSLKAISAEQEVSSRFLVHILLQLKRAGIVKSTRGAGGGYLLAKATDAIMLLDIYQTIEGPAESPGNADWHGPHQVAQKSRITSLPLNPASVMGRPSTPSASNAGAGVPAARTRLTSTGA
jgi:Rrf2 family protein